MKPNFVLELLHDKKKSSFFKLKGRKLASLQTEIDKIMVRQAKRGVKVVDWEIYHSFPFE